MPYMTKFARRIIKMKMTAPNTALSDPILTAFHLLVMSP
jgi:hypothetical protein